MSLKYAVLGLLSQRRSYGYDLVQDLANRVGPAWHLSPSTVYAALEQLQSEGMIRSCSERRGDPQLDPGGGANRRVVYEATEAGRGAFAAWIARPAWRPEPIRGDLYLRLCVARECDVPTLLETIELAREMTRERREEAVEGAGPSRGGHWERAAARLARAGALSRLEAELRWLEAVRDALDDPVGARVGARGNLMARPA